MKLYLEKRPTCHTFGISSSTDTMAEWDFWGVIPEITGVDNGYKPNALAIISRETFLLGECGGILETLPLPLNEMMYHDGNGFTGQVILHLKGIPKKTTHNIIGKYCYAYKVCWDDSTCYTYYSDWFHDYTCYSNIATIMPCLDLTENSVQKDINGNQSGSYNFTIYPNVIGRSIWHLTNTIYSRNIYVPKIFLKCGFFFLADYQYEFTVKAKRNLKTERTKVHRIKSQDIADYYTSEIDVVLSYGKIAILDKSNNELKQYIINSVSMPRNDDKVLNRYHSLLIESTESTNVWRGCTNECYTEILD
jgi:hypothetical protein